MLFQLERIGRHRLADRRGMRQIGKDDAVQQVGAREHTDRLAILAGDDQGADSGRRHRLQCLAHRRIRQHRDRVAGANADERRIEGLLLAGLLRELQLQLLA